MQAGGSHAVTRWSGAGPLGQEGGWGCLSATDVPVTETPLPGSGPASCLHGEPSFPAASWLPGSDGSLLERPSPPPPAALAPRVSPRVAGTRAFNAMKCLRGTFRSHPSDKPQRSSPAVPALPPTLLCSLRFAGKHGGGSGARPWPSEKRSSRGAAVPTPGPSAVAVRQVMKRPARARHTCRYQGQTRGRTDTLTFPMGLPEVAFFL